MTNPNYHQLWDLENENYHLLHRALLTFFVAALIATPFAFYITMSAGDIGGSVASGGSFLSIIIGAAFFFTGRLRPAVLVTLISNIIIVVVLVTSYVGVNNDAIFIIYPLLVLLGLVLRFQPRTILLAGLLLALWVVVLYFIHQSGHYDSQTNIYDYRIGIFIIGLSFITISISLYITAGNVLSAYEKLNQAKEDALRAKLKAESANHAKTQFLANMSHELRTPLTAIIGYSEMITEEVSGESKEDSEKIRVSAKNLLGLINSILEISKIEAGVDDLVITPVNIPALIESVRIMVQPQIDQKGNRLEINLALNDDLIEVDEQKLMQILVNLLSNANKFTNQGLIQLSACTQNDRIIFSVIDTGIGIPKSELGQIFAPFKQVDNDLNRKFDGAGLGLAISKQFATLMGGSLSVESQEGQGARFRLSVPNRLSSRNQKRSIISTLNQ